ncbi:TRAP transporter, DctM subunit [Sphaerochaeta associata]|uniref:TRAP transporter large permease n=1 Tax=Sphaerochaeta associata TaxID=1129264 RepID=A0ABY4DBI6_9SPIR|nr:TRAP transporter large permease [Sphaerochaeta associata]UOM51634.1 TRAP transporter large permease [Sphaerochaeta associata]SMP52582.1 TRAP transporter, DctM subunit [Sphaerochaeta associata]
MNVQAILLLLGSFAVLILGGIHIAYAMIASAVFTIVFLNISLIAVVTTLIDGINGFTFLAIPFFVLAGEIMAQGGISDRLIKLSNALVGWMRGGLAMVNIIASVFFGGISGSATADTASLGSILIPMMKKSGYDGEFSTAVTMASSIEGLLIPPSHNMIIYAMAAGGLSIGKLFLGGLVPGLLLALALMIFSFFVSRKRKYPKGDAFHVKNVLVSLKDSIWALMTILIVVVGVITGVFTATESAAISTVWAFIVTFFIYKEIPLKAFGGILKKALKVLSNILILIAAAGTFGFVVAYLQIPTFISDLILGVTSNKIIILLLVNLILLLLGMIMGMASIIVIMTPILLPIVTQLGMDPIQFGAIMILNCGIGLITPPVGGVLFVGSGISGIKIERLTKELLPFYLVMVLVLLMVTFIPQITMFVPNFLM